MVRRWAWGAGLSAVVAVAGAVYWGKSRPVVPDPNDAALVAEGRAVYGAQCASCHGADLEGQPNWRERKPDGRLPAPPHDASGHTWHHPDHLLLAMTREGVAALAPAGYESDMPAFKGALSEREIAAVIAYVKSRWPADIRERQARITAQQPAKP